MRSTINSQTSGVEYSELYRNLHKEVSEQNQKTAQIPQTLSNYLGGGNKSDTAEFAFNAWHAKNNGLKTENAGNLDETNIESAITALLSSIKSNPNSAYQSQNKMLLNRIAALMES